MPSGSVPALVQVHGGRRDRGGYAHLVALSSTEEVLALRRGAWCYGYPPCTTTVLVRVQKLPSLGMTDVTTVDVLLVRFLPSAHGLNSIDQSQRPVLAL